MIEAGAPSTGDVGTMLSRVCPPYRGWSCSHQPRARATLQERKAKTAPKWRKKGNSAAEGIIRAGTP